MVCNYAEGSFRFHWNLLERTLQHYYAIASTGDFKKPFKDFQLAQIGENFATICTVSGYASQEQTCGNLFCRKNCLRWLFYQ